MDKFGDKCVENEQNSDIQTWVKYIAQSAFLDQKIDDQALSVIGTLFDAQNDGDSCILIDAEHVISPLKNLYMAPNDQALKPFVYDAPYFYLYRYWWLEHQIAQHIVRLKQSDIHQIEMNDAYQTLLQDPFQKAALEMVLKQSLSLITGGPGTGKTYTLARIIAVLNEAIPDLRIAMAAPTGKAAQRMQEAILKSFEDAALSSFSLKDQNLEPVTIHRLLGLGHTLNPRFHEQQPLPYDLIVVDEASMLDLSLAQMLFAAVGDGARLILLGDAQQLASVDVGSVLSDLQQVPELQENHVHLQNSRRFNANAKIGKMAKFILNNHQIDHVLARFEDEVERAGELQSIDLSAIDEDKIQLQYLPETNSFTPEQLTLYYDQLLYGFEHFIYVLNHTEDNFNDWLASLIRAFDAYRILAATRHGVLGLTQLNQQIERRILERTQQIKQGDWYVGRPVMMTYNDYQLGLSNGEIGICLKRYDLPENEFHVYFPNLEKWIPATRLPKNIETAFAMTIHKSQGSEFVHTAVVLDQFGKDMLSKELIYTAITRAKKVVSLLVSPDALAIALSVQTTRRSGLGVNIMRNFN